MSMYYDSKMSYKKSYNTFQNAHVTKMQDKQMECEKSQSHVEDLNFTRSKNLKEYCQKCFHTIDFLRNQFDTSKRKRYYYLHTYERNLPISVTSVKIAFKSKGKLTLSPTKIRDTFIFFISTTHFSFPISCFFLMFCNVPCRSRSILENMLQCMKNFQGI